jgi:hypothetical protein
MQTTEVPFDPTWKNIAISLSGGADSALLTYLLCSKITHHTNIHIISHTRMWKTRPWQGTDSLRVYNWFVNQFPNIQFHRHTNFISPDLEYGNGAFVTDEYKKRVSGDNIEIRAFAEYVCHTEDCAAYYNAVTRNPKGIELGGMKERDIDPTESNKHLQEMQHMGRWAFHPFRFVDKSWVLSQYAQLGIMELFNLTRSCEGEFADINYTNYKAGQYVPLCNTCFWCKERAWAIEQSI